MVFSFRSKKLDRDKSSKSSSQTAIHQQGPDGESLLDEDDYIPQTEIEARDHIAQIREEKNLHGTNSNTEDLQAALVVLSEELYQKPTHFLLELVQNVDDNFYTVTTPTLKITYLNRTLRIDCNEIGFSKRNVAAICRIGQSSKSKINHSRRYIGEKGIGFKSVFKVSDIVWIRSGHYSFRFDKSQRLGMIAPIWGTFPAKNLPGFTSIILELSTDCDTSELIREIKILDPRLLIFLQKLKRFDITINEDGNLPWQTSLQRRDEPSGNIGEQLVTLYQKSNRLLYRIFRLQVTNLPHDPKRSGLRQSELLLAFPLSDSNKPKIESQNVYAFLPIRDYGFKFLLQADFLLIASREDIDSSSQWNKTLLSRIPQALLGAINEFNEGELRYSWLPYLPLRPYVGDFFKELRRETIGLLCKSPILESFAGVLKPPSSLIYVPESFADKEGKPLILTDSTKSKYMSHRYPPSEQPRFSSLGVQSLTTDGFINDLRNFISKCSVDFQEMPDAWHSRLAETLMSAIIRSHFLKPTISTLKVVPLRDGQWASMDKGNFLFPSRSNNLVVPNGIEISEIHPCVETNYFRRQLFMALGAREFQADQICDIIIRTHENSDFRPSALSTSDLIAQVVFLYNADWKNAERRDVWFITETGSYRRGSQVYMNSDVPYSAQSMFANRRSIIHFLHRDYYTAFSSITLPSEWRSETPSWQQWLVKQLNVAQIPRMATPSIGAPFSLSTDFECLLDPYLSVELLLMIGQHWKHYSKWIVDGETKDTKTGWQISQRKMRDKISSINVKCHGQLISPLNKTFLPITNMRLETFVSIPFLDVPDPDHDQWDYLRHFGVVVQLDAGFFLECLRRLKDTKALIKAVSHLYGQIDPWITHENADTIRRSFESQKLIFIPNDNIDSGGNWVGPDECVWGGPKCLKVTPCLENYYPEHEPLLHDTLRIGDADMKTLVIEARNIIPTDTIDRIAQIFVAISKYLDILATSANVLPLGECCIFPVITGKSHSDFDSLCTAGEIDMWFIADRNHLRESFKSLVPLLAFDLETVEKLSLLISALGLEGRVLSKVAKGVSKAEGRIDFQPGYTKLLQKKARCIARLVPKESPNRDNILKNLRSIVVYKSEQVVVEWIVKSLSGDAFYGRADSGRVSLTPQKHGLAVYLTEEDIDANVPPLELQEELANFAEIQDPKHFTLLLYLLMQEDLKGIEDILQRRGISNNVPEFDSASDIEGDHKPLSQPKTNPQQGAKNKKLEFRCRRKPVYDDKSSKGLGTFIRRVERVSNLQKRIADPWGSFDIATLFSRICKLENQDVNSLLPQGTSKVGGNVDDPIGSLFDSKTGIWKDAVIREEDLKRPETVAFGSLVVEPRNASYVMDEETQYIGELNVSTFLEKHLGEAYIPSIHWTSHLRSRAGHMPYECHSLGFSTFTMTDNGDAFTKFLAQWGYVRAASWNKSPVYHVKVVVSKSGLQSEFVLDPLQVKKAQEFSMLRNEFATPVEVFILISVYNILSDPGMALFVDPWRLYVNESLNLLAYSPYRASFKDTTSAMFLQRSPESANLGKVRVRVDSVPSVGLIKSETIKPPRNDPVSKDGLFSYRPLRNHREIRLFELFPGHDDMVLKGAIHHVSVDSPGQYLAISYVWGAALTPFHFQTSEGQIPITVSLHGALQSVRDKENSILLWADAICIDQGNLPEKRVQIRLMRKIFQSAEVVIAWLGDEKENSHEAIEALLQIRMMSLKPDFWPEGLPAIPVSWGSRDIPSLRDNTWNDINMLLGRSWFRRSWIVQELILASNVMMSCGRWTLNWDDFFEALKICLHKLQSERQMDSDKGPLLNHSDPAYALGLTRQSRIMFTDAIFGRKFNLLELLDLFAYTEATHERDKIFALLGLATDCTGEAFDPDYESTMEDLVRRFANEFVRRGHALDLLYRAGTSKSYAFCSWIPFWTRENFPKTISTWRGEGGNFCAGGKGLLRAHLLAAKPTILAVRGFSFDNITQMSDTKMDKSDIISFVNSMLTSIDSLKSKSYPTGETRRELKRKLPIGSAGRPYLESTTKDFIPREMVAAGESKGVDWPPDLEKNIPIVGSIQEMMNFLKKPQDERVLAWKYWQTAATFAKRISNGAFCVTKKGYVGIVPGDAKVGDEVCVFGGSAVPFVLRKNGSEKENVVYELVGEGYVHGIMYGEALAFKHDREMEFHIV